MKRVIGIAAVVGAAAATAAAGGSTLPRSGVYGTVERGPITPVCVAGKPCSAPAAKARIMFTRDGLVATTTSTNSGAYRIRLVPGIYTITTTSGMRVLPSTVRVRALHFTHLDLQIDTGIR
ncbi:MAG TPA: hypothetical protein VFA05_00570 [Gaiellaceae bacterium]|nr:hypothetical protein [Gaiellaceae bacterium]